MEYAIRRQGTNKNKVRCVLLFLVLPVIAGAQDSVQYIFSEGFKERAGFFTASAISQPFLPTDNYALVEGGYQMKKGAYRLSQDAARQQDLYFKTEGARRQGNYLTTGSFGFRSLTQDSVGNVLRYGLNNTDPYYFFARANGNWKITQYDLRAAVSRFFMNEKTIAGVGARYQVGNAWRSNDPRVQQFMYDLTTQATLHYHFLPDHALGIAGGYLRRFEDNSNDYQNDNYRTNKQYADYNNWLVYGMGFIEPYPSDRLILTTDQGWQIQLMYNGRFTFGDIAVKGGYDSRRANFTRNPQGKEIEYKYGSFNKGVYYGDLLWIHANTRNSWTVSAHIEDDLSWDFNTRLGGNNYIYARTEANSRLIYGRSERGLLRYEAGLDIDFRDVFKVDGTSQHQVRNQVWAAAAFGSYYLPLPQKQTLQFSARIGLQRPLTTEANVPATQENIFTRAVIYPDYYYYHAGSVMAGGALCYRFPVKQKEMYLKLESGIRRAKVDKADKAGVEAPGSERWWWQAGVGMAF